jgi:hypothetical protein
LSSFPQVFPQLYLPVMEEGNIRVLRPHRKYLPTPAWFAFRARMARLNAFLLNIVRGRWAARCAGQVRPKQDILDRILENIEVGQLQQRPCLLGIHAADQGSSTQPCHA